MRSSFRSRWPSAAAIRAAGSVAALALIATIALAGCAAKGDAWAPPPTGASPDYQLGGSYAPDARVSAVARDRTEAPLDGAYSICYVNGFQTQPDDLDRWPETALLRDDDGEIRFDPDWPDEALLDTSSDAQRDAILGIVSEWINGCASDGYDAVEFDNLDSYTRSNGALTLDDNLQLAIGLVDVAHQAGLAAGQKNAAEDVALFHDRARFDFVVTEECMVFKECGLYTDVYGEHVIDIEYTDELPRPFADMCADPAAPASMVLRDRGLSTPRDPDYAFELCE